MDLYGIEKFVTSRAKIYGTIKESPSDFCVTEILLDSVYEPPKKKSRIIDHDFLTEDEKLGILEKLGDFAFKVKNKILVDGKIITDFETLGKVETEKRRGFHTIITKHFPWLETRTSNGK
jgi:hypothetical protein